jgi:hypothetical protein
MNQTPHLNALASPKNPKVLLSPRLQPWDKDAGVKRALAPEVLLPRCVLDRINRRAGLGVILLVMAASPAAGQHATFTLPETGQPISFTFQPVPQTHDNYGSIAVDAAGKRFQFVAKNPIARIPATPAERTEGGFFVNIPGLKIDPARYFLAGKFGTDSAPHTLLFFLSEAGASDAASLLVIGFLAGGEPYKVLERNNLDVTSFQPKGDDDALIIGKETMSEVMAGDGGNGSTKPYATTYDPFSVFTSHACGKAMYSLAESETYNKEHYVWAGPHYREDYAVLHNLPGHRRPVGAPATKVNALLNGGK